MTTPQRLRRRQRIEGTALLIVGVLFATATFVSEKRDDRQEACLTDQITKITSAFEARSKLASANTQATRDVILGVAQKTDTQDFAGIEAVLNEYVTTTERTEAARRATKIPPFPNGKCD